MTGAPRGARVQLLVGLLVLAGSLAAIAAIPAVAAAPDTTPPAAPVLSGAPPALTKLRTATITITTEPGATLACSVNGGPWLPCSSPLSLSNLVDGQQTVEARATDTSANEGPIASVSWIVDTTAPAAPTLSGRPAIFTESRSAIIGFVGEADATFTCSVNGSPFAACGASPKALSGLADGLHSLAVKATDLAGNTGPAATAIWTVDTAAPDAPILAGSPDPSTPGVLVNSREASIAFSGEAGAAFTCSVDGDSFEPCGASPKALSGLADGDHSLSVVATDASGKASAPANATWTVDATAPEKPVLTGAPPTLTRLTSATIGFTSESGVSFTCSFDGAEFEPCGDSPKSLTGLADGWHSLLVKATDSAGNHSLSRARWQVGVTPPKPATFSKVPRAVITGTRAALAWSGEEGARSLCSVDGARAKACGTSLNLSRLKDGRHSLSVVLVDDFGMKSRPAVARWLVDNGIPGRPRLGGLPRLLVRSQSVKLGFGGREGLRFQCRINTRPWRNCGSRFELKGWTFGLDGYEFSVRQLSRLGTPGRATSAMFEVTPPMRLDWSDLSAGEFSLGFAKPPECRKGRVQFDLWGAGVGRIHYVGRDDCSSPERRLSSGQGIEGRISPGGVTLTIKGHAKYTVVRKAKWSLSFAGKKLRSGKVLFKRTYRPGKADTRCFALVDSCYWNSYCEDLAYDPDRSNFYCTIYDGYAQSWRSQVGRW